MEVTNRIAFRILVPLTIVSVLLLAIGAVAAWSVHRLQSSVTSRLSHDISSVQAAEELALTASQIEIFLDEFLLTGDPTFLAIIPGLRPETEHSLAEAERLAVNPKERAELAEMRVGLERFWREFADLRKIKDHVIAASAARDLSSHVLTRQVRIPARDFLQSRERGVTSASTLNESLPGKVALGLLLLGVCGAVGGLLAGFGLARGISRSIAQLSVPIRDAAGTLSQVVGPIAVSPTTEVHDLEALMHTVAGEVASVVDRLEQSRRQVVRSEQLAALGQLAAGLAHELRNPLTSIKLLVQAAGENGAPAGLHGRSLAVVEEEIGRLEHLVQSFLDFARPAKLQAQRVDLGLLIEQTVRLVGPRAALKSVAIETRLGDEPAILEADPGHLRQLLLNLLLNALDASEEGGRIVVEIARPSPESDGGIAIQVSDAGCGLPLDLGDRIFEPFVSTKETGLGLGLPICKQIIEAHGGTIEAAPRPGGGAVFTIRLPVGEGVGGSRGRGVEGLSLASRG